MKVYCDYCEIDRLKKQMKCDVEIDELDNAECVPCEEFDYRATGCHFRFCPIPKSEVTNED